MVLCVALDRVPARRLPEDLTLRCGSKVSLTGRSWCCSRPDKDAPPAQTGIALGCADGLSVDVLGTGDTRPDTTVVRPCPDRQVRCGMASGVAYGDEEGGELYTVIENDRAIEASGYISTRVP